MNLRNIEYFLAVAEELNFSRAAEKLRLSQPPLSKSIQLLEKELGFQLFLRDKRSVQLTAAGKAYREQVQPVFELLEQARLAGQRAQAGQVGELRVGFLSPLFYNAVPGLLLRYRKQFPDVSVDIRDMMPRAQIDALNESKIDVAFPGLYSRGLGSRLESKVLWSSPWQVCLHAGHALAARAKLSLQDLRREAFVFTQRPFSPAINEAISQLFERAGYQPQVAQTATQAHSVLGLVAAGVGLSLFPETVSRFASGGLVFIPLTDELPPYEHSMVWNPARVSPVLDSFLEFIGTLAPDFVPS